MSFIGTEIISTGMYAPSRVITNADLEKMMDTSDEWIRQRSGIEQRHWVGDPETSGERFTTDLGLRAAEQALQRSEMKATDLDLILFATLSTDADFPGNACFLQAKLGVTGIPAMDIRQQCSGFLYALATADAFIKQGMAKSVLLVGAEIHSRGMNKTTQGRDVSVLFGDGAGAIVLKAKEVQNPKTDSYLFSSDLGADGSHAKDLWVAYPSIQVEGRITPELLEQGAHFPQMNGKKVFMHATRKMAETLLKTLEQNKVRLEDVDLFLFHQANLRINQHLAKELGIPEEKVFNTIQKYGNTTAATIPIGMDEAIRAGALKKGMLVATAAFGSGFTWASNLFRF